MVSGTSREFYLLSIIPTLPSIHTSICLSVCPNFSYLQVCFLPYLSLSLVLLFTSVVTGITITLVESVAFHKTISTTKITIIQIPTLLREFVDIHRTISTTHIINFQIFINDQRIQKKSSPLPANILASPVTSGKYFLFTNITIWWT